jgi:heptose I phosphotransferase
VAEQLLLSEPFATLWRDRDAFAAAFALQGEEHRALEQRQTLSFLQNGRRYFVKRHRGATWREIFKNLVQARLPVVSACNEWRAITLLRSLGIATPRIVGYGRRGLWPSRLESFLITEDVGPHQSLEDLCRPWRDRPPGSAEKRRLMTQVAQLSRIMHGAGVCHRDFYLCHLLQVEGRDGLTVIDLHRALCRRRLARRWIVKDIAGLYFSSMDAGLTARDRLRFIRLYTGNALRQELTERGEFWEAVRRRGMKLYRKDRAGR